MSFNVADYLYNRLPQVYRTEDREQMLKRFMDTFAEAGYNPLLQDTVNIMDLLDVDKCPSKFLPQLCKMYGYEYTLEIPELFQRRLLKYIVEMYKRKGTKSVVRFIARELTGFDSEIIENKDFNQEHIDITHWDIRFEHYRNFILKLTAPYEDSNLFNKEDIVIKIVNDFLPTNSQVLVITAYWFKEESEIVKKSLEGIFDVVKDYNQEVFTKRFSYDVVKQTVTEKAWLEVGAWWGEEDSYLNYPIEGMTLVTNAVVNLRDTIKFNVESYIFLNKTEEYLDVKHKSALNEGESIKAYYNSYTDTQKGKEILEEISNLDTVVTSLNTLKLQVETEYSSLNKIGQTTILDKIQDLVGTLSYSNSRITASNCDIMGIKEETTTFNFVNVVNQDNVYLNTSKGLITNALFIWDIVKEQGKPDKIILL